MDPQARPEPTALDVSLSAALQDVRRLVDRRTYLERELTLCEMELRDAWRLVPHMPVRSAEAIELEGLILEKREVRLLRAMRGDKGAASILKEMLYG